MYRKRHVKAAIKKKVDQIEGSPMTRGRGRSKKTIYQTIESVNDLSLDLT